MNKTKIYKKGDIVKAEIGGVPLEHICIILEDEPINGHVKCLQVCNLTSSKKKSDGEYHINLENYSLPDIWFNNKKPNSWLRCNKVDCIYSHDIKSNGSVGNLLKDFPLLWKEICTAVINCDISAKLNTICECQNDEIRKQLLSNDCGCS